MTPDMLGGQQLQQILLGRGHELCGDPGCTTEQEQAQVGISRRNRSRLWLFSGYKQPP